jgi:O-antigen biosynthesis protein
MDAVRQIQTHSWSSPFLETSFFRLSETSFGGYVVDANDLRRIFTIDILIDGVPATTALANEFVQELTGRSLGDSCYGFSFSINRDSIRHARSIEARVSNLGTSIGTSIDLMQAAIDADRIEGHKSEHGSARWLSGLRFAGWVDGDAPTAPVLDVFVDGGQVSRIKALGWAHQGQGDDQARPVRAFDFQLPDRFADGCVHQLKIVKESGETLGQAGLPFVAFADGLAATISGLGGINAERLRGELFDQIMPKSLAMSQYESWCARFPISSPAPVATKGGVILIGAGNVGATLPSLDDQTHNDWVAVSLEPAGQQTAFDSSEARAFLDSDGSDCDFVVFALAGTVFASDAMARIASTFEQARGTTIVYGDVDLATTDRGKWPLALPAFDYERMLEQGFCAYLFAMRRETAQLSLAKGASNLYRLFNAPFDGEFPESEHVAHLPGSLATMPSIRTAEACETLRAATREHLAERNIDADVVAGAGVTLPAVHVTRPRPAGRTTVIIPTRNRLNLLRRCLDSIAPAIEKASADVLVIDNDSSDPETCDYLDSIVSEEIRVLRVEGPFNFSRLNNIAVDAVTSDYLCLLNNDVEAMDDQWLEEMLGRMAEPDVGAVGALLLWPSGVIQHGGVVTGASFAAHHAFNDRVDGDPGPGDMLRVARECSAITAACMLTRRDDYLEVGGMDEFNFSVAFNDVDYCLKLRAIDRRVVFTPHARLLHLESASRGRDDQPDRKSRFERELRMLRQKWSEALLNDPYYNPLLSLDSVPYSALAWPPRSRDARWCRLPVPVDVPPGM